MGDKYDFSGWATRNDLKCSDGRVIRKGAFKVNDGATVPVVWNHQHNDMSNVLGHALLENRDDGVYAYVSLNDTENGRIAKECVQHGDIEALSIWANQLQQKGSDVLHGVIREVSLVLAGANPGAYIESVLSHGEDEVPDEAAIYTGMPLDFGNDEVVEHAAKKKEDDEEDSSSEEDTEKKSDDDSSEDDSDDDETIADVFDTMTQKQQDAAYAMIAMALGESNSNDEDEDDKKKNGGNSDMKHNVFDNDDQKNDAVLSHSDLNEVLESAKNHRTSISTELKTFIENDEHLSHDGVIDDIEELFPEYKDVYPGAPELIERDQGWVTTVMNKVHKSPISRIRTRQIDVRDEDIRAYGYQKGNQKAIMPNGKLLKRTTDPQTVYVKDKLERDDIIDITDFDVVNYQYGIMKNVLNEEVARAIMIGDGREDGDDNRIYPEHIRDIWHDDELYTLHWDVDIDAAKEELQGTNTNANFGENYIYAEAIITAALYSREKYKGEGTPDFYCTPHLLNVMLLARDLNGRRIYDSKSDLAAALNVGDIFTAEQFEGLTRVDANGNTKKLLGIFVNLSQNYSVGSTKGGEITRFEQFDIDFNQEKYLIETRLSGALTHIYSAIALEEPVSEGSDTGDDEPQG